MAMHHIGRMAVNPTWFTAPVVGFEPTTHSLTGSRSTVELHRNVLLDRFSPPMTLQLFFPIKSLLPVGDNFRIY